MSSAFHIHIGGAGVMIGDMLWKLYEKEYNEATQNNYIMKNLKEQDSKIQEAFICTWKEDAQTFPRGFYTVGKYIAFEALDCIRKQIETMNRLDEFVITSSISGGTGSGCFTQLSYLLKSEFGVKQNGFIIFSSSEMSNTVVGVYNAVFSNSFMTQEFNSTQCLTISQCTMLLIINYKQKLLIINIQIIWWLKQLVPILDQENLTIVIIPSFFQICVLILECIIQFHRMAK
ncbi:unnamed protein product [Paramecium octaurelia]|uniref:Tubulin/FtsZ GTPase domain-containing protein n=1 Tax=Paramecium octaurelia TaxID=43137 RepID=A0A8S1YLF5_PAROT|nr:unnamed protein product [Paramecium octaurelia]